MTLRMSSAAQPDAPAITRETLREMVDRRIGAGISIRDFAARMGISRSYLFDLEQGNRPFSPELLARYRKGLKR